MPIIDHINPDSIVKTTNLVGSVLRGLRDNLRKAATYNRVSPQSSGTTR